MAKSVQPQRKKASPRSTPPRPSPARAPLSFDNTPDFFLQKGLIALLLFALAFSAYLNTLHHGFTLDDEAVITGNAFTKAGIAGIGDIFSHDTYQGFFQSDAANSVLAGGRYRPLSVALFAVVWQFFGENPFVYHLLTVTLYALTCAALYGTLLLLFGERLGRQHGALLAFFSTVLFVVHPIHTEAVANVKGCDEILSLLFSLGSLYAMLMYVDTKKPVWMTGAAFCFLAACLSKENAVTFMLVVPLAVFYFRNPASQTLRESARGLARLVAPLLGVFMLYFVVRGVVTGWQFGDNASLSLMNNPFVKVEGSKWVPFSFGEKMATIFHTLGLYVKLLFFPHPLTHDYYPRHIEIMTFKRMGAMFSLLLYVVLTIMALSGLRKRSTLSFGIWFFLITLSIVSNLVFQVGTNMSERFLFMPSVGFSIVAGVLLLGLARSAADWKGLRAPLVVLGVASVLFLYKTMTRNRDWVSNDVLFFRDVEVSRNSAKVLTSCGASLYRRSLDTQIPEERRELTGQVISYMNRAIDIHPNHVPAIFYRGLCYEYLQNYMEAVRNYAAVTRINPAYPVRVNLARALKEGGRQFLEVQKDYGSALDMLTQSWEENGKDAETAWLLGRVYRGRGDKAKSIEWLEKAVAGDASDVRYLNELKAVSTAPNAASGN